MPTVAGVRSDLVIAFLWAFLPRFCSAVVAGGSDSTTLHTRYAPIGLARVGAILWGVLNAKDVALQRQVSLQHHTQNDRQQTESVA